MYVAIEGNVLSTSTPDLRGKRLGISVLRCMCADFRNEAVTSDCALAVGSWS
jgi:hypothetical protein